MYISKKNREIVKNKYSNKCAYCGTDLIKGWHVDHIKPKEFGGTNDLENLNPSCPDCNNYKRHSDLEGFRHYTKQMLNDKLEYLFKSKTKMRVAINMGAIKYTKWDGVFYFERVSGNIKDAGYTIVRTEEEGGQCIGCDESTGETKLWCCNHCGKRIEDF